MNTAQEKDVAPKLIFCWRKVKDTARNPAFITNLNIDIANAVGGSSGEPVEPLAHLHLRDKWLGQAGALRDGQSLGQVGSVEPRAGAGARVP